MEKMRRSNRKCIRLYLVGVAMLIVLLFVNLAGTLLPWHVTKLDAGEVNISRISEKTKTLLANLREDVNVYWLCENGVTDYATELFLTRYEEASDCVSVQIVDTTEQPNFASEYIDSGGGLSNYSLIVESKSRVTVLDFTDLYLFSNDVLCPALGVTYLTAAQLSYYMTYYQSVLKDSVTSRYFRGESQLSGAIDYVTAERVPHGYILTGHGDTMPSDELWSVLSSSGVRMLDLAADGRIPTDADCLILYAPEMDLTEAEETAIRTFLTEGGSFLLVTDPSHVISCPRAVGLGSLYGLSPLSGTVYDMAVDAHVGDDGAYLVPSCNENHPVGAAIGQSYTVTMPTSHAIEIASELPDGVTAISMLTTSDTAVRKTNDGMIQLGDPARMNVAAVAEKSVTLADGDSQTGHFIWFGSTEAFTAENAQASQYGNYYCLLGLFQYASTQFESVYSEIPSVCLDGQSLTVSRGAAIAWSVALIFVLPAACLGIGVCVRAKRRH